MTAPSPYRRRRVSRALLLEATAQRPHRPGHRTRNLLASLALFLLLGSGLVAAGLVAGSVVAVGALEQGLPNPTQLDTVSFAQPTHVYDRTGKTLLATFQQQFRRVVPFDQIPRVMLDAQTTAEDRTFWTNAGVDPTAIVGAVFQNASSNGDTRGASTITQQLVRAVLLPKDVVDPKANQYVRKMKEIIQSIRLTQTFPGMAGKEKIITDYLNDIYYGHQAYGIAAAAETYFSITDLSKLTAAQSALLAGLVKSPTTLDPYNYAKPDSHGRLVVAADSPPVVRRNFILANMPQFAKFTKLTKAQVAAAEAEPVILTPPPAQQVLAPQFVAQVRAQLVSIFGSEEAVDTGGYTVITSLDYKAQQLAEKWVAAGTIVPNQGYTQAQATMKSLGLGSSDRTWINRIINDGLFNGALVAEDPRTGDVLAYVGSAGFYRSDLASPKFAPQYDVASAPRQPGSAWKPFMYGTGFEQHIVDPGTLLIDASTPFSPGYTPHDADFHERGPVLLRKALQYSLNIPAIQAYSRIGSQAVTAQVEKMGITFPGGPNALNLSGLSGAIGTVEVPLKQMVAGYSTYADGGVYTPQRTVLEVDGPNGKPVWKAPAAKTAQAISAQTSFLISNILEGNTDPAQNLLWGPQFFINNGPKGEHRPATLKTGTTNDARDLTTFGYIAPPADPNAPGLAVGVWIGNSDHSPPNPNATVYAVDVPAHIWKAFVRDYTQGRPVTDFQPPSGVVQATIDAWSGGAPGPWTRETTQEWFIQGTEPGAANAIDKPGQLYTQTCGTWAVDTAKAEVGPTAWIAAAKDWMVRASKKVVAENSESPGPSYFWGRTGFGGPLSVSCSNRGSSNSANGGRHGRNGATPTPPPPAGTPAPTATPAPTPAPTATPAPTPAPTATPTRGPKPTPPGATPSASPAVPGTTGSAGMLPLGMLFVPGGLSGLTALARALRRRRTAGGKPG